MRTSKYDVIHERLEVDVKASNEPRDPSFYEVEFEIRDGLVTVGTVKYYRDKFQSFGQLVSLEEDQQLYKDIQDVLQVKFG